MKVRLRPRGENLPSALRLRMPRDVVVCAVACAVMFVAYGILYLTLRATDPELAAAMLRLFGWTILAGRETALFDAVRDGMPLGWALGLSVFDDVATLLLNIALVWILIVWLHRVPWARCFLARTETQALRHRKWVQRWGLLGLALFYLLPGFGSGPAVAASMGALARIPARRLAPLLGGGVALVDVFWAIAVSGPAKAYPDVAWLDWLPLLVLGFLLLVAGIAWWRDRPNRGILFLDWDPRPTQGHAAAMRGWGIEARDGLVQADVAQVARAVPVPRKRVLFALELLLLDGMTPEQAAALVRQGVTGVRDLAGLQGGEIAAAAGDGRAAVTPGRAAAWRKQALEMLGRQGSAWQPGTQ